MNTSEKIQVMDWQRIFSPEIFPAGYIGEIAFRTAFMFLFLILMLKFLSKRGVKQLSVFELAILIALGSATGDPMFYKEIPITHGVAVLVVVIILYKLITWLTSKSKMVELLLEGKPQCLITEGVIEYPTYKKMALPHDKFFSELRLKGADHLGQLRKVYLETSGEISVYFFSDPDVKPGLPIYPEILAIPLQEIKAGDQYACIYCGTVVNLSPGPHTCPLCANTHWAKATKMIRTK